MEKTLNLTKNDPWLEPYKGAIVGHFEHAMDKKARLTNGGGSTLSDLASGYLYFGLHRTDKGWIFCEWTPSASHVCVADIFSNWEEESTYKLKYLKDGNWEIKLPADAIKHGDLCKLHVYWGGSQGE